MFQPSAPVGGFVNPHQAREEQQAVITAAGVRPGFETLYYKCLIYPLKSENGTSLISSFKKSQYTRPP